MKPVNIVKSYRVQKLVHKLSARSTEIRKTLIFIRKIERSLFLTFGWFSQKEMLPFTYFSIIVYHYSIWTFFLKYSRNWRISFCNNFVYLVSQCFNDYVTVKKYNYSCKYTLTTKIKEINQTKSVKLQKSLRTCFSSSSNLGFKIKINTEQKDPIVENVAEIYMTHCRQIKKPSSYQFFNACENNTYSSPCRL